MKTESMHYPSPNNPRLKEIGDRDNVTLAFCDECIEATPMFVVVNPRWVSFCCEDCGSVYDVRDLHLMFSRKE